MVYSFSQPTTPPAPTNAPAPTAAPTAAPTEAPTTAPTAAAPTVEGRLTVFAAASLTDAFAEIATAFEAANPGTEIVYNFAGSQQLAAQINEGAPADVFASANAAQMRTAVEGGRITIVYTTDAALESANLQQIAIPDELNTIANYPIAPVGDSANPALAAAFIAFVRSAEGQAILAQYGFLPVE
jgi:molybdate transport system substrate-binding protein